ncbi:cysteine hydrolase family protein [Ornithinicoccus halotolerans]|uniref:cysteine hydrolase family protein n=1 Tax=Ornithinicoccus halotolerans TaxID=1748220 RepID=UPI001E4AA1E7|nr:cysteine hydrolase [Ornithinicoccus halotolerans]
MPEVTPHSAPDPLGPQRPWLLVIDPQRVFTDPTSQWRVPRWEEIVEPVRRLVPAFGDRVVLTRWVPKTEKHGSWRDYFREYQFADRPADHPTFALDERLADLSWPHTVLAPTFGKWTAEMRELTGPDPHLVVAGVATDCCVISTVLPAVDDGARVTVVTDGCAGSTDEAHEAAMSVMAGYFPQAALRSTDEVLPMLEQAAAEAGDDCAPASVRATG